MTTEIKRSLKQHEEIIQEGIKSFLFVGQSLMAIRDEKLYRESYSTFEAYCKDRWDFSRPRAYQLIEAAEAVTDLSTNGRQIKKGECVLLPTSERQARALAEAARTPEERARVWERVVETAPRNGAGEPIITSKLVNKVAVEVVRPKKGQPAVKAKSVEGVVEPSTKSVDQSSDAGFEFPASFDPTTFDPEMNSELDRRTVANLPRDQQLVEQPKMIEAFCRGVSKFVHDNMPSDPLLDEGALGIAEQQLKSFLSSLRQRKVYGFCPKCPGEINPKCGFCKGYGLVNRTTFESAGGVK